MNTRFSVRKVGYFHGAIALGGILFVQYGNAIENCTGKRETQKLKCTPDANGCTWGSDPVFCDGNIIFGLPVTICEAAVPPNSSDNCINVTPATQTCANRWKCTKQFNPQKCVQAAQISDTIIPDVTTPNVQCIDPSPGS